MICCRFKPSSAAVADQLAEDAAVVPTKQAQQKRHGLIPDGAAGLEVIPRANGAFGHSFQKKKKKKPGFTPGSHGLGGNR